MAASTPKELRYHMPAEWEPHEATWLSWPKNPETFPPSMIGKVEDAYCSMIGALSSCEKVKLLVDSPAHGEQVRKILAHRKIDDGAVLFYKIRTSDVWMRDYCPIFVVNRKNGKKAAVKWRFNAWGSKYDDLAQDDSAGEKIAQSLEKEGAQVFRPNIVMEGGSIDVNGQGALITTEQCLLNKNRNPNLNRGQIEQYLCDYLGAKKITWLKDGIEGDDTDGHIDDFARFVGKSTVICAKEEDKQGANHAALEKNAALLSESGLEVIRLPMPSTINDPVENRRLPASYANFYIGNKVLLLPIFGCKNDREASETLQPLFPGREIIPVRANELVYGYGGIHCVTQQELK